MSAQAPNPPPDASPPPPARRGFSWGFIVFMVLIAGFAALVATPNFPSPDTPIRSSMRAMQNAIAAYYADNNAWPAWTTSTMEALHSRKPDPIDLLRYPTFRARNETELRTLTTPVAYLSELRTDTLAPERTRPFRYVALGDKWIIWSTGPDRQYELTLDAVSRTLVSPSLPTAELLDLTYDPSNGTISCGDVWRIKQ